MQEEELEKINRQILHCPICLSATQGKLVVGEGSASAKIVFIGEAPGKKESETGRPFVGRSGKLLRNLITSIGLAEDKVYITSPVKYLPPKGMPTPKEIAHGKIHLEKQLAVINPKIVVLLGATACKALLSTKILLGDMHGKKIKESDITYFITFHPAAALRFPLLRKKLEEDFLKLGKAVGRKLTFAIK